jgi:hypothetical protein
MHTVQPSSLVRANEWRSALRLRATAGAQAFYCRPASGIFYVGVLTVTGWAKISTSNGNRPDAFRAVFLMPGRWLPFLQ